MTLYYFWTCSTKFLDPGYTFKVNVFYRTIAVALHELNTRFEGHQSIMKLFSINLIFQTIFNLRYVHLQLSLNLRYRKTQTVMDVLKVLQDSRVSSSFPQFHKLLVLFLTIPVTVAAAERSFSKLKLIKTYPSFVNVTYLFYVPRCRHYFY